MTGLVVFCLFGDDPHDIYYKGAIRQASLYKQNHPTWDLWFYVGRSVPDSVLSEIFNKNDRASFEFVEGPENQTATYWRMQAIFHSNHDFILFRDVDSRLMAREIDAVKEWLASDYPYHTMRDHPFHGRPLLAGLWGVKREAFGELQSIPKQLKPQDDFYGTDQIALQMHVWPKCRRKIMAHIGCYQIFEKMEQRRPFRVPRSKDVFVGCAFNGDNSLRYPGHEKLVIDDAEIMNRPDIFDRKLDVSRTV